MTDELSGGDVEMLLREVRARVPADAAQLLAHQSPEHIEQILRALPKDAALSIAFELPDALRPAGSASESPEIPIPGQISELMEPATGVLAENVTAAGALDFLVQCPDVSRITYLYVTDAEGRLTGLVVMRDLLLAKPGQLLRDIMLHEPFAFRPDQPLSDAVRAAVRRHYPVYPVVDAVGHVVGQVRGWKLFERQAIELTAQSGSMVGVNKEERVYTPTMEAFRQRHPWLQINLFTAFGTAFVISMFEATIAQIVVLAAFLPVLSCLAGNNGCQAMAITLRGITLGDMETHPLRRLLTKEVLLGFLNGAGTGIVGAVAIILFALVMQEQHALMLGVIMLAAMIITCMMSCLLGTLVPLVLRSYGADPATASSIFLLTFTDIFGMGLMLLLATVFLL
jgi:magnesium transporter